MTSSQPDRAGHEASANEGELGRGHVGSGSGTAEEWRAIAFRLAGVLRVIREAAPAQRSRSTDTLIDEALAETGME